MGDDRFPSRRPVHGFDRMQHKPRPGDRVARDDDRHVFLEALLGAREHFIVTYVGRSAHDDREQPAAVVVTDLLDAIARGFEVNEQRLVTRHRLHPFSPRYFASADDDVFFSYATSYSTGARAIGLAERATGLRSDPAFVCRPLTRAPLEELRLDDLIRWVTKPARALLSNLGVSVEHDVVVISEREPTQLGGLEAWDLRDELSRMLLEEPGLSDRALIERMRARGVIPLGANGTVDVDDLIAPMRALVAAAVEYRRGDLLPPEPVDLMVDGVRIVGALRALWPLAQLDLSVSKEGKSFELKHFVRHVVLGALRLQSRKQHLPARSAVVARRGVGDAPYIIELAELDEPYAILQRYVAFAREARRGNFSFEYNAAYAYAEKLEETGDAAAALDRARAALKTAGKLYLREERLLWGDAGAVLEGERRAAFEREALDIIQPMLRSRREIEVAEGRGPA
jgi:exodeoxyribonuclease V gamma subunit